VQTYFRDTPAGHVGCEKLKTAKPLETRPTKFIYDWGSFEAQNKLVYKLIKVCVCIYEFVGIHKYLYVYLYVYICIHIYSQML
jgi:hypothetical protein